jgi:CBS domain-containing protein
MKVCDVMVSPVHLVDPGASLVAAARQLRDQNVGALPVGEGEELLGMITDRDIIVRCIAEGGDCSKHSVRDAMSSDLLVCFDDQPVEEAARLMEEHRVRRLPVLGQDHRLVGIVSLNDLLGHRDVGKTQVHRVVFYKELSTSAGQQRRVPMTVVHITDRHTREEVEAAALRKFERDRGVSSWKNVADAYEVFEPR